MKNWNESWKICVFKNEICVIPKKSVKRKSILKMDNGKKELIEAVAKRIYVNVVYSVSYVNDNYIHGYYYWNWKTNIFN